MTKLAAVLAGLGLVLLIGGTALYTIFGNRSDLAACGISASLGSDLGGPLTLKMASGETVTEADLFTRPSLLYFGYTYCPDICPLDMARNALVIDRLAEKGVVADLIFVTIDPARDTREALLDYIAHVHPRGIALTGTDGQIAQAARAYRAQYSRGAGDGEFYLMDHSTATYLVLPGNRFAGAFSRRDTAETIADKSLCMINGG